jgi:hypothetical protein
MGLRARFQLRHPAAGACLRALRLRVFCGRSQFARAIAQSFLRLALLVKKISRAMLIFLGKCDV